MKKLFLLASTLLMTGASYACDNFRDDVAVIFNNNSAESQEIADYYAEKRCITAENIIGINTQNAYDVHWDEFKSINNQLIQKIAFLINNDSSDVSVCSGTTADYWCEPNVSFIKNNTSITTLVMIKGMPARMNTSPWDSRPASMDNYLRFSLIKEINQASDLTNAGNSLRLADLKSQTEVDLRRLNPSIDDELVIGRIDGLTLDTAKALVDRAIEAEQYGIGGSWFWDERISQSAPTWVYPKEVLSGPIEDHIDKSRYWLGLNQETALECTGYSESPNFYLDTLLQSPPQACSVKYVYTQNGAYGSKTNKPGFIGSRLETAENALVYAGYLDSQSSYWAVNIGDNLAEDNTQSFQNLLNWRKNFDGQECKFCDETVDPEACRLASTDAFQEIDTRCAGVSNGFMGYNYQSFPTAYFSAWPTGWRKSADNRWLSTGGGDTGYLALPIVKDNQGYDDSHSLWFGTRHSEDDVCVDLETGLEEACTPPYLYLDIEQRRNIQPIVLMNTQSVEGRTFTISFRYQYNAPSSSIIKPRIYAKVYLREQGTDLAFASPTDSNCDGRTAILTLEDTQGEWETATFEYVHDLDTSCHYYNSQTRYHADPSNVTYNGVKLILRTVGTFTGELGIDNIEMSVPQRPDFTLINSSFDQGYKQNAVGDHPSVFLSRLNGTAFWGSLSHHLTGGHTLRESTNSLIHFFRGLPLAESVWAGNGGNGSGILYGDPLYNPVAVRINKLVPVHPNIPNSLYSDIGPHEIYGTARNGTEYTDSVYSLQICEGHDFAICDRDNTWQIIQNGATPAENALLGTLNMPGQYGDYTLRLSAITMRNEGPSIYNDHLPIVLVQVNDIDADGVPDDFEEYYGFTIGNQLDDNSNGIQDDWEAYFYRTEMEKSVDDIAIANGDPNPCDEVCRAEIINREKANADLDNDWWSNYVEYRRGTDPSDATDVPNISWLLFDREAPDGGDGSAQSPFNEGSNLTDKINAGDFLILKSGDYSIPMLDGNSVFSLGVDVGSISTNEVIYSTINSLRLQSETGLIVTGITSHSSIIDAVTIVHNKQADNSYSSTVINGATLMLNGANTAFEHVTLRSANFGIYIDSGTSIDVNNSIIVSGGASIFGQSDNINISYSLVSDGSYGGLGGNIGGLPNFSDEDLHIGPLSPTINAGDPTSSYSQEPQPNGSRVNMGAYGNTPDAQFFSHELFITMVLTN